ncbi:MAG TPA: phosphotransferase [Puia sp.]
MPIYFPATYSTLSSSALASWLEAQYFFADVRCRLLVMGVGDTYLAETATGRYILRVYRPSHRSREQIIAEIELLLAAKEAGVSVSYPIADRNGQHLHPFSAVEGERHAVVFSYAPGNPVSILNETQLRILGWEIARFHNVSSTVRLNGSRWTFDPETTLLRPLERVKPYFEDLPEEYDWWQQAAAKTITHLAQADGSRFSAGFCQFDFLPKNFHFDGDALTLFDFDFFGYGWLVNDLMTVRVHLDLDVHFGRLTREAAGQAFDSLLAAYREIRPLSDDEVAAVPWLSLGFWCFYMGFHSTHDVFHPLVQASQLKARTALIRKLLPHL